MNQEIKARWVAALRSGEYRQIKGWLADTKNGRCCLGVLCDVAAEDGIIEWQTSGINKKAVGADSGSSYTLPHDVMEWAALEDDDPESTETNTEEGGTMSLSALNDSSYLQFSFDRIADVIERDL